MAARRSKFPIITPVTVSGRVAAAGVHLAALEPYASDLAYLEHELLWVGARARRIIFARLAAGTVSADLPGDLPEDVDVDASPVGPMEAAREQAQWRDVESRLRRQIDARLDCHRRSGAFELGLDLLVRCHGLSPFERTVLLLAVAPCLSAEFEPLYGRLDAVRSFDALTVDRTLAFAEVATADRVTARRRFASDSPLIATELVDVGGNARCYKPKELLGLEVILTLSAFGLLIGQPDFEDELASFSAVEAPRATFDQVVLPDADRRRIQAVVDHHSEWVEARRVWGIDRVVRYGRGAILLFHGPPGTGKTLTAHAVADRMGLSVFNVDMPTFAQNHDAHRFLPALFRAARHRRALLFFDECEVIFGDRRKGNALMTMLLSELERFEGVAILATNLPDHLDEALGRRILVNVAFPRPDHVARRVIWEKHLPPGLPLAADVDVGALADRLDLSGGLIKNAVLVASATAIQRAGGIAGAAITQADLEGAARDHARHEAGADASIPKVRLEDVILPSALAATVKELVGAARSRRTVLETWGLGSKEDRGLGVTALFHGEPGTGKTLCAEAIAGELCRPLVTANITGLLSKWVGESERNLSEVFAKARAQGAVLLLDECDSLLRARSEDASSRHHDGLVNTLLSLLERQDGLVILVTNLPGVLDRAVARRIAYSLGFPAPDAATRSAIWQRQLPDSLPREGDLDVDRLGRRFVLTGAGIKNAVLRAAFRAASRGTTVSQWLLEAAATEERDAQTAANH